MYQILFIGILTNALYYHKKHIEAQRMKIHHLEERIQPFICGNTFCNCNYDRTMYACDYFWRSN